MKKESILYFMATVLGSSYETDSFNWRVLYKKDALIIDYFSHVKIIY